MEKFIAEGNKDKATFRQCPGCGKLVERVNGCPHTNCKCKTEFYIACGSRNWKSVVTLAEFEFYVFMLKFN